MRHLIAIAIAASLTACTPPVRIAQPPPEYFTCADAPAALTPPITDADDTQWKIELLAAYRDCKNAVLRFRDWFSAID